MGQARFANAVYTYQPDFAGGDYKEGVVAEGADHVVFEFNSPYIVAATPANNQPWGIYDAGCRNGLVLRGSAGSAGKADCAGQAVGCPGKAVDRVPGCAARAAGCGRGSVGRAAGSPYRRSPFSRSSPSPAAPAPT